jgi:hypothetical protein
MTLAELMTAVRRKLDDAIGQTALDEETVVEALNAAQNEFATETLCVFGSDSIAYTSGNAYIALPAGTVWVIGGDIAGVPLTKTTQHQLDYGHFDLNGTEDAARFSAWRAATGTPKFIVSDYGPATARLVPEPDASSNVTVERYKLPAQMDLEAAPDVEPEIPIAYHEGLVHGALAYLFDIPDLEIYDVGRAVLYAGKWTKYIASASISLQTATRRTDRVLSLPEGSFFPQPGGNTIGAVPNSNTEGI